MGIVLIVALPFVLYSAIHYFNTVSENEKAAIKDNFVKAGEIAREVNSFIEESENILYSLALHPAIINNDHKTCDDIFSRLLPLYPYHLNILAADMLGRNIGSAIDPDKAHSLNYSDKDWFKKGSGGISTVNDLHLSKLFTKPSFMITMPAFDSRGVQTAILGFPVNLLSFQDHLVSTEPTASNSALTIIDNNENILIDSLNKENIGKPFRNASIISEISKDNSGSLVNIDPSGTKRFYSYATVEATGWKVLIGVPVRDVYVEANRAALTHLIFFFFICGAGIGLSMLYSRKIAKKVETLINGFNEIASGNLDYTVTISGEDEFAYAAQEFNRMIAERKFAEYQIMNLADSLEKRVQERTAELMNAKFELEAFSYTVSHDLQAPARHVLAFSEILLNDHSDELTEESRNHLKRIRRAGENMQDMITHLLALSNINRKEMNRIHTDLSSICKTIISELQESEPDRIVKVTIEDALFIDADPVLLEISLRNLLENAWKYTGKSAEPFIEVGQTVKDEKTCFFIKDNGCGFDMTYAEKVFVPFQRLHSALDYDGSGVGLSTVFRIVQRHGGFIIAESSPGEGAVFYFKMSQGE